MQRSGFFNALLTNGQYDRTYNANDYADNLAVVISNGVLRSVADDLKVTASGMVATVGVGRAWIEGHYYVNDTPYKFAATTTPAGGSRYDRIMLRLDKSLAVRSISLIYVQGTASNAPEKPAPVREGNIYDIVLADVYVVAGATSVQITDTRGDNSVCGWVYSTSGDNSFFESLDAAFNNWFDEKKDTLSSVSLFKRYNWRAVLESASNTVLFSIPQYDAETCFIEVFVNGIIETEGVEYTLNGNLLTFGGTLIAGTEVEVKCYKSLDGTGIMSVADEITELQNAVATINISAENEYLCNGFDDNIKLSEIALDWLNGGDDHGSKIIRVYGTFGAAAPYGGDGTRISPYKWFVLCPNEIKNRRIVFDFSACGEINVPVIAAAYNVIFSGLNVHIIGASVKAINNEIGTYIYGFDSTEGVIRAENCRFWLSCNEAARIAHTGTFINCFGDVTSLKDTAHCFHAYANSFLRIEHGEYYAYTGNDFMASSPFGQTGSNAVSILNGVNMPTAPREGLLQTQSIIQYYEGGIVHCYDLVSELPLVLQAENDVRGTIIKSKPNMM